MSRKEELMKGLEKRNSNGGMIYQQWVTELLREIALSLATIADALPEEPEIIRCKDCKHGSPNGRYGCRVYHYRKYETHDMKPDDFCSHAERR